MIRRCVLPGLLLAGVVLAGCSGSDEPTDAGATADTALEAGAEATSDSGSASADESETADASSTAAADLSGVDACAVLTDEAIDQALTAQLERELTVTVERTPGTNDTEELGGPQRTCSFGVSDEGGYYSWDLRIVSASYFDEQRLFAGDSLDPIEITGADDSFGFTSSEQVWAQRGGLAVTIQNSSATQGLSLRLLEQLLPALG